MTDEILVSAIKIEKAYRWNSPIYESNSTNFETILKMEFTNLQKGKGGILPKI